jgi:hypothetical protein
MSRRPPAPPATERDVVLCWREPGGAELAGVVAEYLERRGFRVFSETTEDGPAADRALRVIEEAPDLVLIVTPGALAPCADAADPLARLLAHALATQRNIVPLLAAPEGEISPPRVPPGLAWVAQLKSVWYYEGIGHKAAMATLAHRLSSETGLNDRHVERRFKRWFVAALAVLVVGFALQAVPLLIKAWTRPKPKPPLAPFALYWAGFGQRLEAGRWVAFDPASGTRVSAGEQLRLVFSPSANGFAYVVARDGRGGVTVLFPAEGLGGASRVKAGQLYEAPVGGQWLAVDQQTGLDAIYVVAGYDPYQNLEELLERPEMELTPADRRDLLNSTLSALVDGRHAPSDRARTRTSQTIDRALPPAPGPAAAHVTLADGGLAERPLTRETGLVSALAELRFRFDGR